MTVLGSKKLDRKGRATGPLRTGKRGRITWQFLPLPYEMIESPAFRSLGLAERRVLDRIQCELGRHGGIANGSLIVTYRDFEDYGIDKNALKPAIKVCVALGFLEVTQQGRSGVGEYRRPNAFRLTYMPVPPMAPTNEWSKVETIEQARAIKSTVKAVKIAKLRRWSKPRVTFLRYAGKEDIESTMETPPESAVA
jgi:hypothetical protein